MHRFLGTTGAAGVDFGDTLISGSLIWACDVGASGMGSWIDFFDSDKGPRLVNRLGGGGLGVLVRDGLVNPSLVSSAVDARLALLIIDRRRDRCVLTCTSAFWWVVSGFFNARVSSDSFRSVCARTADF
jgi:hypothetical protein